jgi:catechol 2,3-dioxygenase-like lactoylglutathione lyase family enzyme
MTVSITRTLRATFGVLMAGLAFVVSSGSASAQPAPATQLSGPRAVGISILHLNVSNLDRSLALYRDVLGMEVTTPAREPRANPGLVSEPGAVMRTVILRQPGGPFSLELVEFSGVALRPVHARIQDPGAVMLAMSVRDLDAKLAAAKQAGFRVLTRNGTPFVNEGRGGVRNRAVMISDPDGFIVEFTDSSAPPPSDAPAGAIMSVTVYVTARDLAETVNFYNKAFGLQMASPAPPSPTSERVKALFDDPSLATMRTARASFPGGQFSIVFQEFAVEGRKPARHRVQDPGGPILLIQVQEFPAVIDQVKANGGIVGQGETSEALGADARSAWVRDPNGVLLRLSPPATPRAGGAGASAAPEGRSWKGSGVQG